MIAHDVDRFMMDKLDAGAAWMQRRGYRLTRIRLNVAVATLFAFLGVDHISSRDFIYFMVDGSLWGLVTLSALTRCKLFDDYGSSARMMQTLNAIVLQFREATVGPFGRLLWLAYVGVVATVSLFQAVPFVIAVLYFYLGCAFYLGPGEFDKVSRKAEVADGVRQGTS